MITYPDITVTQYVFYILNISSWNSFARMSQCADTEMSERNIFSSGQTHLIISSHCMWRVCEYIHIYTYIEITCLTRGKSEKQERPSGLAVWGFSVNILLKEWRLLLLLLLLLRLLLLLLKLLLLLLLRFGNWWAKVDVLGHGPNIHSVLLAVAQAFPNKTFGLRGHGGLGGELDLCSL